MRKKGSYISLPEDDLRPAECLLRNWKNSLCDTCGYLLNIGWTVPDLWQIPLSHRYLILKVNRIVLRIYERFLRGQE